MLIFWNNWKASGQRALSKQGKQTLVEIERIWREHPNRPSVQRVTSSNENDNIKRIKMKSHWDEGDVPTSRTLDTPYSFTTLPTRVHANRNLTPTLLIYRFHTDILGTHSHPPTFFLHLSTSSLVRFQYQRACLSHLFYFLPLAFV